MAKVSTSTREPRRKIAPDPETIARENASLIDVGFPTGFKITKANDLPTGSNGNPPPFELYGEDLSSKNIQRLFLKASAFVTAKEARQIQKDAEEWLLTNNAAPSTFGYFIVLCSRSYTSPQWVSTLPGNIVFQVLPKYLYNRLIWGWDTQAQAETPGISVNNTQDDLQTNTAGRAGPTSGSFKREKPKTKIGAKVEGNADAIRLALASLALVIDAQLESLQNQHPNSRTAINALEAEIAAHVDLKARVDALSAAIEQFLLDSSSERRAVAAVKTFSQGIQSYWTNNYQRILDSSLSMTVFTTSTAVCAAAGAPPLISVAVGAAFSGNKMALDAIKSLRKTSK